MEIKVYKSSEDKAKRFAELMNDMEWHTKRELLDELEIPIKSLMGWLKNTNIEKKEEPKQVSYIKHGKWCTNTYNVFQYRAKEKIEIKVIDNKTSKVKKTVNKTYLNPSTKKWEKEIRKYIDNRKIIKKNELVDIGIEIKFYNSVKELIRLANDMGVNVI